MSHWWSHRIVRAAALLTGLTVLGTIGYVVIERWPVTDALFMTVAILSTVGLGEPHPLSPDGRIFTVALIVTGVSVAAYLVTALRRVCDGWGPDGRVSKSAPAARDRPAVRPLHRMRIRPRGPAGRG